TPEKVKYRKRIEEGYNLPGSPSFRIWKKSINTTQTAINTTATINITRTAINITAAINITRTAINTTQTYSYISTYWSAKKNAPMKKTSKYPNFVNGPTALKIQQEEHLQFLRDIASKQQRLKEQAVQKQMK
ncbi:uncharacterized protein LOC144356850, partial [Saccoglossus kowalevskii]